MSTGTPIDNHPDAGQSLIIGPTQSGKTSLLGAVDLHATTLAAASKRAPYSIVADEGPDGKRFRVLLKNLQMQAYKNGTFGAEPSQEITTYRFRLKVRTIEGSKDKSRPEVPHAPRQRLVGSQPPRLEKDASGKNEMTRSFPFLMSDGPGEGLFAERYDEKTREDLLNRVKSSLSLIMCVDSTDESMRSVIATDLPVVLESIINSDRGEVALKRFAFVLTKADRYFIRYGPGAHKMAQEQDPWKRLQQLLGRQGWGAVKEHLDFENTAAACGWASAYGFIPEDGYPNYISDEAGGRERLRTFDAEDPTSTDWGRWEPFRVLDPFLFVATSELGNMKPYAG